MIKDFQLLEDFEVPVFNANIGNENITVLFDTGAVISVWTDNIDVFESCFSTAKAVGTYELSGFGPEGHVDVPLYTIPYLEVGAVYKNVPLCVSEDKFDLIDLVVPNTFFTYDGGAVLSYDKDYVGSLRVKAGYGFFEMRPIVKDNTMYRPKVINPFQAPIDTIHISLRSRVEIPKERWLRHEIKQQVVAMSPGELAEVIKRAPKSWFQLYSVFDMAVEVLFKESSEKNKKK